jgi:hypothetical protein
MMLDLIRDCWLQIAAMIILAAMLAIGTLAAHYGEDHQ